TPTAPEILTRHGKAVDKYLQGALARLDGAPSRLIEAIDYSVMAGGKRLRPALVLECESAVGGRQFAEKQNPSTARRPFPTPSALAAAGAIELIHTFSLVHDDLPAMDNDDLRRGRPTNHVVFGEATAILAGDAMTTLAFELIANAAHPATAPKLVAELARAAGPCGMIGGQILDMAGESQALSLDQLKNVHRMKTGALIVASCRMGCICAEANPDSPRSAGDDSSALTPRPSPLSSVTAYAQHLGLAFQIIDDVLDETATAQQMGKATRKDAARGKNTYTSLLGLAGAQREATNQLQLALAALVDFGPEAEGLRTLARFVVERHS
ncbi:MAG TPA: polyprenyl synthetase family protein, partial [Tepidisphaeraceae bacterium]|nr:polyprenyl synthetase family protein [Tepidisphaeraceae bacterium]